LLAIAKRGVEDKDSIVFHSVVWLWRRGFRLKTKNPTAGFGSGVWKFARSRQHPTAALRSSRAFSDSSSRMFELPVTGRNIARLPRSRQFEFLKDVWTDELTCPENDRFRLLLAFGL
jgi:hypothetical protein